MTRRDEWIDCLLVIAGLCCAAAAMLLMTSCSEVRLSKDQAQALSEARAGATAAKQKREAVAHAQDPVQANLDAQEALDNLTRGLIGFVDAATVNAKLPAPLFAPSVLLEQPEQARAYGDKGVAASMNPPKGVNAERWAAIGTAAVVGVGFLLRIGRNVPGIGGTVAGILSPIWNFLVPAKVVAQEKAVDHALDVAVLFGERLSSILSAAGFRQQVEDAKLRAAFMAEKLGVREEIEMRLREVRDGSTPPLPALPVERRPPVREVDAALEPTTRPTPAA
jgi:hypothetical protein